MEPKQKESASADSTDQAPGGAEPTQRRGRDVAFEIPAGTPRSICRSCKQPGYWIETKNGKQLLVDPNGQPHFATCPDAAHWRKRK